MYGVFLFLLKHVSTREKEQQKEQKDETKMFPLCHLLEDE